jgi:AraC-like DNA-binding protein
VGNVNVVYTNLHFHMQSNAAPIRVYWYNHVARQMLWHAHEFSEPAGCTPRHLSRRFKQATGKTVGEYVALALSPEPDRRR